MACCTSHLSVLRVGRAGQGSVRGARRLIVSSHTLSLGKRLERASPHHRRNAHEPLSNWVFPESLWQGTGRHLAAFGDDVSAAPDLDSVRPQAPTRLLVGVLAGTCSVGEGVPSRCPKSCPSRPLHVAMTSACAAVHFAYVIPVLFRTSCLLPRWPFSSLVSFPFPFPFAHNY